MTELRGQSRTLERDRRGDRQPVRRAGSRTVQAYEPPPLVVGPGGMTRNDGGSPNFPIGPGGVVGEGARVNGERVPSSTARAPTMQFGRPTYAAWRPQINGQDAAQSPAFPIGPGGVTSPDVLEVAANATGAPQAYLRAIAQQEGVGDPNARNPRSSASGLMQFTEGTWLQMLREHGADYGLPADVVDQIRPKRGGGVSVTNAQTRERLLDLRFDAQWSALMGAHLFNREAATMQQRVGGPISVADVYMGHFMGGEAGGWWIRQIREGRGNMNARQALRRYYAGNRGQAEAVIDANPRQFSERATVASVYRMQTEDLVTHAARNGVDPRELRQVVRSTGDKPRRGAHQLTPRSEVVATERNRQNAGALDLNAPRSGPRRDPVTGEEILETAEERRIREQQAREDRERADRQRGTRVGVRRGSVTLTTRF